MALFALLCLVVVHTCVRIELLNVRAGGVLPRPATDTGKWRTSVLGTERGYRIVNRRYDPTLDTRPLTTVEQEEMGRHAAWNDLRWWVGWWGIVQYPAAAVGCSWAVTILARRPRAPVALVAWTGLAVCLAAGALAYYRGYFASVTA